MENTHRTLYDIGVLVRLICFIIAEVLTMFMIHGRSLFMVEELAIIRFFCVMFASCLPLLVYAEIMTRGAGRVIKFLAIGQTVMISVVLFKYLLGPSLIAMLSYRAQNLYLGIVAVFLGLIVIQLWFGESRECSRGPSLLGFWYRHPFLPCLLFGVVGITVIHRSIPVIP